MSVRPALLVLAALLGLSACSSAPRLAPVKTMPAPVLLMDVQTLTPSTVQVSVRVDHYNGFLSIPQVAVFADYRCGADDDGDVTYSGELLDEVPAKFGDLVTAWVTLADGENLTAYACVQYEPQRY